VVKLVDKFDIRRVFRAGRGRTSATWCKSDIAIASEMAMYEIGPEECFKALGHSRERGEPPPRLHVMPFDGRRDTNLAATELAPGGPVGVLSRGL
jgi:hypothetical protein